MKSEVCADVIQIAYSSPQKVNTEEGEVIDQFFVSGQSVKDCLSSLKETYGIELPKNPKKFFEYNSDGSIEQVGFVVCRWNSDISHNTKAWWERNLITFCRHYVEPVKSFDF